MWNDTLGERNVAGTALQSLAVGVISAVAVVANVSLFLVVLNTRHLRNESNVLILSLSLADLLVSAVSMPITMATIIFGTWKFTRTTCVAVGYINMLTFTASVQSLAVISVNRYVKICRPSKFADIYTYKSVLGMCLGVWLVSGVVSMPPLIGWAAYSYLPNTFICFCEWQTSASYAFFMVGFCFCLPCAAMTFCNVGILRAYIRSKKTVDSFGEKFAPHVSGKEIHNKQIDGGEPNIRENRQLAEGSHLPRNRIEAADKLELQKSDEYNGKPRNNVCFDSYDQKATNKEKEDNIKTNFNSKKKCEDNLIMSHNSVVPHSSKCQNVNENYLPFARSNNVQPSIGPDSVSITSRSIEAEIENIRAETPAVSDDKIKEAGVKSEAELVHVKLAQCTQTEIKVAFPHGSKMVFEETQVSPSSTASMNSLTQVTGQLPIVTVCSNGHSEGTNDKLKDRMHTLCRPSCPSDSKNGIRSGNFKTISPWHKNKTIHKSTLTKINVMWEPVVDLTFNSLSMKEQGCVKENKDNDRISNIDLITKCNPNSDTKIPSCSSGSVSPDHITKTSANKIFPFRNRIHVMPLREFGSNKTDPEYTSLELNCSSETTKNPSSGTIKSLKHVSEKSTSPQRLSADVRKSMLSSSSPQNNIESRPTLRLSVNSRNARPTVNVNSLQRYTLRSRTKSERRKMEEFQLAASLLTVILLFIVCWFPYCVSMFLVIFSPERSSVALDLTSLCLGYFNSCLNPIVYGVMNTKFKMAYKRLLLSVISPFRFRRKLDFIGKSTKGRTADHLTLATVTSMQ
uniref:G-protein coupled receptors family 1 profile domain-containing protein n=1 Tax=Biomphalaria glabrata TaxID=6526 RepID=A0A2C9JXH1_BIOGL